MGALKNGKVHGSGSASYEYPSNMQYSGDYKNGFPNGVGNIYDNTGTLWYRGMVESGLAHGTGVEYDLDGSTVLHNGSFAHGTFLSKKEQRTARSPEDGVLNVEPCIQSAPRAEKLIGSLLVIVGSLLVIVVIVILLSPVSRRRVPKASRIRIRFLRPRS